ncbi:phosphatidylinositol 4-kinase gamma 7-like isoform X2 [Mercurialis annua]|uniref:phosphatidylinositol 4-kinase gamma 7-like isoform X2 n=1 Tax=Mercurialis annua TaxID=3986 RepID=UPI00215FA899|nr:phosphatidylinositol 4-kinase gamma 7-like isoform X2 [Mercurialis annua]
MYHNLDHSVHPDMAIPTFRASFSGGEHCGSRKLERKPSGRRRVFVQTESGFVLGLELDRSDNAHTVKKKLQLALNVPTEETSLNFGDMVFKNDLSAVRNDSPLLLTKNFMHRSSSTPCLSPAGKDLQQSDQSGPIVVLGFSNHFARVKELVKEIVKAIRIGIDPIPVHSGLGGAYYFKNCDGDNVAIVKPTDEEPYAPNNPKGFVGKALGQPGLKRSVRVGETGFREVAAYLLDYDHFANVPSTALVKVTHSIFNVNGGVNGNKHQQMEQVSKIASLQQFIHHDFDASDHGTSSFPVADVHRIGILDIRILNTDRHGGNLLVRKLDGIGRFDQVELVPIDHGLCLPESLEDPYFEWIHWPQASIPFSEDELDYIGRLDPFQDCDMLRRELPMIREACLRVLIVCTVFLKEAAAFGLCLAEIGEMMSREFRGHEEEPSEVELICIQARSLQGEKERSSYEAKAGDIPEFQFGFDSEGENGPIPLSRVVESVEEEQEEVEETEGKELSASTDENTDPTQDGVPTILKPPVLLKSISAGEKSWRHVGVIHKSGYLAGTSSGNRSVNEQLPASASFVKFTDLTEREWVQFLENFQTLLCPAFGNRKLGNVGQRHRHRLGTSCQF